MVCKMSADELKNNSFFANFRKILHTHAECLLLQMNKASSFYMPIGMTLLTRGINFDMPSKAQSHPHTLHYYIVLVYEEKRKHFAMIFLYYDLQLDK